MGDPGSGGGNTGSDAAISRRRGHEHVATHAGDLASGGQAGGDDQAGGGQLAVF